MAGIAGIESHGKQEQVALMLDKISHRGGDGSKLVESQGATIGAVWPEAQAVPTPPTLRRQAAWDGSHPPLPRESVLTKEWEHTAMAAVTPQGLFLSRDPLGVRPLYYGHTADNEFCFASEVKALLEVTNDVHEFAPGSWYESERGFHRYQKVETRPFLTQRAGQIVDELRLRLEQAIARRIDGEVMGSWLSGGLDSSAIVALLRPHVRTLHTFAAGFPGAPDLIFASQVAEYLDTHHHEILLNIEDLLAALPEVIYHLESFDALLVRSSITNYLVAKRAADYVGTVFSGEGGDELFAGYAYLKDLSSQQISSELVDITQRLHNTALQRVDRSASAHGLAVHVPFLDPDVVQYALQIPPHLKLLQEDGKLTEKWVVRKALVDELPENVLWRTKSKFWEGAGVGDLLSAYADEHISHQEFLAERNLPNGWRLNTREELMYYRIFREHFGELSDLSWMGRTKGAPVQ